LIRSGYKFVLYVSFEHIIEQKKAAYYQALMEGQRNRYKEEERIDKWTVFFLDSLSELILKLEQKLKEYRNLGGYMNVRQKEILNYIQKNQPIKLGDLTKDLPQYSAAIIKKDLQYLVNEFEIEKLGNNRGTIYKIKAQ
jgi:Fic family protein